MDSLEQLRRHASLTDTQRAYLDFQINTARARPLLASLLAAILRDEVDGFHPEPGDYCKAFRSLMELLLQGGVTEGILTGSEAERGRREARCVFDPAKQLELWGETRIALEGRRRAKAMQSLAA